MLHTRLAAPVKTVVSVLSTTISDAGRYSGLRRLIRSSITATVPASPDSRIPEGYVIIRHVRGGIFADDWAAGRAVSSQAAYVRPNGQTWLLQGSDRGVFRRNAGWVIVPRACADFLLSPVLT